MISQNVIILDVIQGSEKWFALRRKYITSTDAAVINGTSPWKTRLVLFQEKLELSEKTFENDAMREGRVLEGEARDWYNRMHNTHFEPCCIMNKKYPWMFTSLDGYDKNTGEVLEIKCGKATYDKISKGSMSPDYIDQAQHHICVSDQSRCHYVAYRPDKTPIDFFVKRDQSHIDLLLPLEKEFYDDLIKRKAPSLDEKDFRIDEDPETNEIGKVLREVIENKNEYNKKYKELKPLLFERLEDGNCIIPEARLKIFRRFKRDEIDYKKLIKEENISQEIIDKYKIPETSALYITLMKEGSITPS